MIMMLRLTIMELHKAIELCERALVSSDPTVTSFGQLSRGLSSSIKATNVVNQSAATFMGELYRRRIFFKCIGISPSESFLQARKKLNLAVHSSGHALHVFINGVLSGRTRE